jgi:hypothetical protein
MCGTQPAYIRKTETKHLLCISSTASLNKPFTGLHQPLERESMYVLLMQDTAIAKKDAVWKTICDKTKRKTKNEMAE